MTQPTMDGAERSGAIAADEVGQTGRILAVDATPQNLRLFEAILLPRGYAVLTATSGQRALEIIAEQEPDLILLDIMMPGLDGHEVCRRLRADPATALLPIIMV